MEARSERELFEWGRRVKGCEHCPAIEMCSFCAIISDSDNSECRKKVILHKVIKGLALTGALVTQGIITDWLDF